MDFSKIIIGVMRWGIWEPIILKVVFKINRNVFRRRFVYFFDHADIYGGYTTEELFGNAFSEMKIEREKFS